MLYFVGIDPDLHSLHTALISCQPDGTCPKLQGIWTVKTKGAKNEEAVVAILKAYSSLLPFTLSAVAIESQQIVYTGRTNAARPQDLIHLAQVAGGLARAWSNYPTYLVSPHEWKGSVPKHIKQARIFSALGIKYSLAGGNCQYAVPENFKLFDRTDNLNAGDWIDAGDSVGLALYAAERYFKEKRLTALRK